MPLPSSTFFHDVNTFFFGFDVRYILFPFPKIISSPIIFKQKLLMWKELHDLSWTEMYILLEAVIYFQKPNKKH